MKNSRIIRTLFILILFITIPSFTEEKNEKNCKSEHTGGPKKKDKDSNGHVLQSGDSVVLIKSLDVKGSTINAKLGTVVRNIRLVENNTEQIEGRVEGQVIVILTKYVKKQH